jgi:hypothetical protein
MRKKNHNGLGMNHKSFWSDYCVDQAITAVYLFEDHPQLAKSGYLFCSF